MRENDDKAKQKMKHYAELRNSVNKKELDVGDTVLVKQRKMNTLTTPFDSSKFLSNPVVS